MWLFSEIGLIESRVPAVFSVVFIFSKFIWRQPSVNTVIGRKLIMCDVITYHQQRMRPFVYVLQESFRIFRQRLSHKCPRRPCGAGHYVFLRHCVHGVALLAPFSVCLKVNSFSALDVSSTCAQKESVKKVDEKSFQKTINPSQMDCDLWLLCVQSFLDLVIPSQKHVHGIQSSQTNVTLSIKNHFYHVDGFESLISM